VKLQGSPLERESNVVFLQVSVSDNKGSQHIDDRWRVFINRFINSKSWHEVSL